MDDIRLFLTDVAKAIVVVFVSAMFVIVPIFLAFFIRQYLQ